MNDGQINYAVCLKSEIHEIHEIQSLARNPLPNQRNPLPKKRNPRNPLPTTKSTFVQPETKKRNPPHRPTSTVEKITTTFSSCG